MLKPHSGIHTKVAALFLSAVLACSLATPSLATFFLNNDCEQPVKPFCVDRFDSFEDSEKWSQCRDDFEAYLNNAKVYSGCLELKASQARQKLTTIENEWRCRSEKFGYLPHQAGCEHHDN